MAGCYDFQVIHSGTFLANCDSDAAFDLLSKPERLAPLLPDFESMVVQDETHFTMRTVLAIGKINGHLNLAMELREASRPRHVEYRGQGIVAGSTLQFELAFRITPVEAVSEVQWSGEVKLEAPLMFMAGDLLDTMAHQNFERMAQSVQQHLTSALKSTDESDFEI